jgi:hypothetical protein
MSSSGKCVENYIKLTCLEIIDYRIKYSAVLCLIEPQITRVAYFQRKIQVSGFSAFLDGSLSQLNRISEALMLL